MEINPSTSLRNRINTTVRDIPRSGIRDFFDIVTTMKEDINGYPYGEYRLIVRDRFGRRKAA